MGIRRRPDDLLTMLTLAISMAALGYSPKPGFQAFRGDISEMIAVKGSLTDGELANLEAHLMSKYGLH